MSPLAFDKQGKPFTFHRRCKQLLVRLFRNPSARGTCCQVFDPNGQPLYVDSETDHTAFRKEVGQVPGLYRLDQCDENGDQIEDAPAAYVSIDVPRNASAAEAQSADVSPLVIIQQMAAIQADVMKTMAQQQAALMAATAEIMRAPYRPAPVVSAPELRNADASDDKDEYEEEYDTDEEGDEEAPEEPTKPLELMMKVVAPHAPEFGKWLWKKFAEFLNERKGAPTQAQSAAVAVPVPVSAAAPIQAPQTVPAPVSTAAGSIPTPVPVAPTPMVPMVAPTASVIMPDGYASADEPVTDADAFEDSPENANDIAAPAMSAGTATAATAAPSAAATTATAATALPVPTPEQLAHLYAIREHLAPKERAIAERAISRMDPLLLVHWLAELSSMSVEDATAKIRDVIAQLQPRGSAQA